MYEIERKRRKKLLEQGDIRHTVFRRFESLHAHKKRNDQGKKENKRQRLAADGKERSIAIARLIIRIMSAIYRDRIAF